MKNLSVKDIIGVVVLIAVSVFVIYTMVQLVQNFGYNQDLGIYYTKAYSFTVGDLLQGNDVTYTYTNLNVLEILDKIY